MRYAIVPCGGGNNLTCEAHLGPLRICAWSTYKRWHNAWALAIWKRVNSNGSMILCFFFVWDYGWSNLGPLHRQHTPPAPPRNKGMVMAGLLYNGNQWGSRLTSRNGIEGLTFFGVMFWLKSSKGGVGEFILKGWWLQSFPHGLSLGGICMHLSWCFFSWLDEGKRRVGGRISYVFEVVLSRWILVGNE